MTFFQKRLLMFLISGLLAIPLSFAARDGQVGATSTGEIAIRLELNQGIQISNLKDIQINISNQTDEDVIISQRFCVRANQDGRYTIAAEGDGGGSQPFGLFSRDGDKINFELYFRGDLSLDVSDRLYPNVLSREYNLERTGINCDGQNNAELSLRIPVSQINAAISSEYDGFLNLTVAIE